MDKEIKRVTIGEIFTTPYKVNFLKHVYKPDRDPDFEAGMIQFWETEDGIIARGSKLAGAFGESLLYVSNCRYEPGTRAIRTLFAPWSRITPRRSRDKSVTYLDEDIQLPRAKKRALVAYWKAIKHYRVYSAKNFSARLSDLKTAKYAKEYGPIYEEDGYIWAMSKTSVSQHFFFKRLMPVETEIKLKIDRKSMVKQYISN